VNNWTPNPRDTEINRLKDELAAATARADEATAQLAAGTASDVVEQPAPTSRITSLIAAPQTVPTDTPEEAQVQSTHAVGPGSAGPEVAKVAQLVEAAGEKTYLSDPNTTNTAHVFTDELLNAVRRVLFGHPEIASLEGAESDQVRRWINGLQIVGADVVTLLEELAKAKTGEPAA
jgi:murein L,D-transpeptidase YcbB/YkuD